MITSLAYIKSAENYWRNTINKIKNTIRHHRLSLEKYYILEYCSDFSSGIELQPCLPICHKLSSGYAPKKGPYIYLLIYPKIAFSKLHDGSRLQKTGPFTPACVRLKKEIINIALEAGCELITALGTHQHTCSTVLCCYTFPEVQMSSFTVITFLPPLTIDYLHFSISSPPVEMAHMARYTTDLLNFTVKEGGSFTEGGRGKGGQRAARTDFTGLHLPISNMLERTTGG